jgi:hypothetical protein
LVPETLDVPLHAVEEINEVPPEVEGIADVLEEKANTEQVTSRSWAVCNSCMFSRLGELGCVCVNVVVLNVVLSDAQDVGLNVFADIHVDMNTCWPKCFNYVRSTFCLLRLHMAGGCTHN